MKYKNIKKIKHGLYKVYWKSGGNSLAALGYYVDGEMWIAPINWSFPTLMQGICKSIDRLERIEVDKNEE